MMTGHTLKAMNIVEGLGTQAVMLGDGLSSRKVKRFTVFDSAF